MKILMKNVSLEKLTVISKGESREIKFNYLQD